MSKAKPGLKQRLLLLVVLLIATALCATAVITPRVLKKQCVGCGDCVKACPTGSITLHREKAVIDAETCINCNICVKTCPYQAIEGAR